MKRMMKNRKGTHRARVSRLMNFREPFFNKKGIVSEALPWIIISISILAILMITIFILKGKGITVIDSLKDLFKF